MSYCLPEIKRNWILKVLMETVGSKYRVRPSANRDQLSSFPISFLSLALLF